MATIPVAGGGVGCLTFWTFLSSVSAVKYRPFVFIVG